LERDRVGKGSLCTFMNLLSLFKQEKDNLRKEIFLKNCINLVAITETYGIEKKGNELVTCGLSETVFYGDHEFEICNLAFVW